MKISRHIGLSAVTQKDIAAYKRTHPSLDDQLNRALHDCAVLHEIRHFHDCFGTFSGISLFEAHVSRLLRFLDVCQRLGTDGLRLRLPFCEWTQQSDCPDYVKSFAKDLHESLDLEKAFTGELCLPEATEPKTTIWRSIEVRPKVCVPAFLLRIGAKIGRLGEVVELPGRWVPIGFERLIEGNAQAMQRTYVERFWGPKIEKRLLDSMMQVRIQISQGGSAATQLAANPYNTTDLMLTRYLEMGYGIMHFPRDRVTELADRGLMGGRFASDGRFALEHPGGYFVSSMENANWSGSLKKTVSKPTRTRAEVQALRDELLASPLPEDSNASTTIADKIRAVASHARHRFMVPLLDNRIEHGDEIFFEFARYQKNFTRLPMPPIIVVGPKQQLHAAVGATFAVNWSIFAMFSHIADQIWSGKRLLACPRAYNSIPGIDKVEFLVTGCQNEIDALECMTWDDARSTVLPDCTFSELLKSLNLQ